jgi:flagellar operon protein
MDELLSVQPNTSPVQPLPPSGGTASGPRTQPSNGDSFDAVLRNELLATGNQLPTAQSPVKFSTHAQQRLQQRDITLGEDEVAKINQAVDRAQEKGSKESLILLDDLAFVVSVKNRVVITAVDQPSMKQNVFTNIDSVVIA